jgi:hypothetical protein
MFQDPDTVRKLNELSGTIAALVALMVQLPQLNADILDNARELIATFTPPPLPNSPGGSAPIHFATHTLDRIATVHQQLAEARDIRSA